MGGEAVEGVIGMRDVRGRIVRGQKPRAEVVIVCCIKRSRLRETFGRAAVESVVVVFDRFGGRRDVAG